MCYISSYPTYEEWKHKFFHFPYLLVVIGSYPTYEEWKQQIGYGQTLHEYLVLILPMRNGNMSKNYAMEILYNTFLSYL